MNILTKQLVKGPLFLILFCGAYVSNMMGQETISIVGVGDIMMGTNFPSDKYLPPNDGRDMFTPVLDILVNSDLTFGNLEGVLLTGKGKVKRCSNPAKCYAFKSPDHYVDNLVFAGFDLVSMANNHANDFGKLVAEIQLDC